MLEERISKNIGVPYVYLPDKEKFLCENGVLFTKEEYINGIDLNSEYKRYANHQGILKNDDKVYTQIKMIPYSFELLVK